MEWHYANNGQKFGPVTEEQLLHLAQGGVIQPDTLVWHAGMTDWRPFREAGPAAPPPVPGDPYAPKRFCTSCSRQFALSELAMFGDSAICMECKPAWAQRLRQGMTSTAPVNFRYAGFWIRFLALILDGMLTSFVFGIIFWMFFGSSMVDIFQRAARGRGDDPFALMGPMMGISGPSRVLSTALGIAYQAFFLSKFGATPGKMALGLKVITPDGGPVSVGRAIGRYFGTVLSGLILGIGFMMAGWDDEKRALHDRICGTRVIKTR